MGGVFHVCFRPAQGFERFADFRMPFRRSWAGVAGSALAAGVARGLAWFGAAGAAAMNLNTKMRHARASRLTILVFMKHSASPNYGSDRRICASYSHLHAWRLIPVDECHGQARP